MKRRDFVKTIAAGAAAWTVPACMMQQKDERPNIILIVTDDQRYDALRCAGNPIIHTPEMDKLAAAGVRFDHAFVTTPICAAGRASIFTGLYERTHGFTFTKPPLTRGVMSESYPVLLRRAGYFTGFIGKFGIQVEEGVTGMMFDRFQSTAYPYFKDINGRKRHLTDIHGDMAAAFLKERPRDKPFCLSLSFWAPHAVDGSEEQYFWPEACDHLYRDATIPPPPNSKPEFFQSLPGFLQNSMNRERWHWRFDTPGKYQKMVKGYYRMISGVDRVIGRLRQELARQGIDENTVILLMGDNGYFLGERGFAGKWLMHDVSIRVPLIIYDPRAAGSAAGTVIRDSALNLDLAPTILDLAGQVIPDIIQGRSLKADLRGGKAPERQEIFCEHLWDHPRIPQTECVRTKEWKYIRYRKHPEYEELYHLTEDPHESRNLACEPDQAERRKDMRGRCRQRAKKAGSLEK